MSKVITIRLELDNEEETQKVYSFLGNKVTAAVVGDLFSTNYTLENKVKNIDELVQKLLDLGNQQVYDLLDSYGKVI